MIRYTRGNILDSTTDALVNTVNEIGVMGKGIALQFRESFPDNSKEYAEAAARGEVQVGRMLVHKNTQLTGPKWIINFPTKRHWRNRSRIDWIVSGLQDLKRVIIEYGIRSVALPPLGCGNGKLEWVRVRSEIEAALGDLREVEIVVYTPTTEYYGLKRRKSLDELTPARALIAALIRRYSILDTGCTILEVQKLAWFLSRVLQTEGLPDPLGLTFKPSKYGPYADRLRHLLDGLDGSYLNCEKRLSDAGPYDAIWFNERRAAELDMYLNGRDLAGYRRALERTSNLIQGFESPLGMELLATVDWLIEEMRVDRSVQSLRSSLKHWPGGRQASVRKASLFDERLVSLALHQLMTALPEGCAS